MPDYTVTRTRSERCQSLTVGGTSSCVFLFWCVPRYCSSLMRLVAAPRREIPPRARRNSARRLLRRPRRRRALRPPATATASAQRPTAAATQGQAPSSALIVGAAAPKPFAGLDGSIQRGSIQPGREDSRCRRSGRLRRSCGMSRRGCRSRCSSRRTPEMRIERSTSARSPSVRTVSGSRRTGRRSWCGTWRPASPFSKSSCSTRLARAAAQVRSPSARMERCWLSVIP